MNFRKISFIALIFAVVILSTGCVEREIVINKPINEVPDVTVKENIEIDWDQVMEDCEAALNEDEFPYGSYLDFAVHDDENLTEIIWPVKPECPIEEMPAYAEAYAKAFNDAVATQDFKYAVSSDDSYGGYWDTHDMDVQVYYEKDIMWPENYWINQLVPAGTNDKIILNPNLEQ